MISCGLHVVLGVLLDVFPIIVIALDNNTSYVCCDPLPISVQYFSGQHLLAMMRCCTNNASSAGCGNPVWFRSFVLAVFSCSVGIYVERVLCSLRMFVLKYYGCDFAVVSLRRVLPWFVVVGCGAY